MPNKRDEELCQILVNEIDESFLNNRYPGDHGIGGKEVSAFRGKWEDISLETIVYDKSSITEFSTEGFAYYLPAFLKAVITHHQEVDVLADKVLLRLIPPEVTGDRYLIKVIEELNAEQRLVIRDFLVVYKQLFASDADSYTPMSAYYLDRAIKHWTNAAVSK